MADDDAAAALTAEVSDGIETLITEYGYSRSDIDDIVQNAFKNAGSG